MILSIKNKFLISAIIMLVLPIFIMILFSAVLLVLVLNNVPHVSSVINNAALIMFDPTLRKYIILWLLVMVIVVVVCCICVITYLSRSIIHPLQKISEGMKHLTDGDLEYEFTCSEDLEIRELYTDIEKLRMRLKQSVDDDIQRERENRMMIANMSHDLRTPITSIKGYTTGIMDGVANTPEKMEKYLNTILLKAETLEGMVNNLSVYSKIDYEAASCNFVKTDICELLKNTMIEFSIDLKENNITQEYHGILSDNTPVYSNIDIKEMKRVFSNIIGNSIKYKKPDCNGKIDITANLTENGITLIFTDNGIGIDKEDEKKVFETFYRADPARNINKSGNGLGLALADRIIKNHGGRIWIRSDGKDKGISVYISLATTN